MSVRQLPSAAGPRIRRPAGTRGGGRQDSDGAKLVVVANRLPFDLEKQPDGSTKARRSPGGLVTALEPILSRSHGAWIGWPGSTDVTLAPTTADSLDLHPVRLSGEEVDHYYEGFANATLWPLYHDAVADSQFRREWWIAYERVNQRFADRAADVAAYGATVWVHDYQLQLVPEILRKRRPDLRIGFFMHIPFPPTELFNRLPWRSEIVRGLLGADLIGFQLPGGSRNFVRLARTLLGLPSTGGSIDFDGRTVRVDAFPISIDSAAQSELAANSTVLTEAAQLRHDLGDPRRIILGVDRLDYTKGIDIRLKAYGELLAERDPAVQDAVMIQVATPSRERLDSYVHMREHIERQVGSLNGDFGRIGRPAVQYLHQSFPREELAAFYVAADVMTVTPLRDGMNLVAKEYVACRNDGRGTLLLSEFAGAAHELRSAVLVNPYDTDGVKEALRTALTMPVAESRRRMRAMRRQVMANDVDKWAADFLSALDEIGGTGGTQGGDRVALLAARKRLPEDVLHAAAEIARTGILLIGSDFDGTLAPIVDDPAAARPIPESVELLRQLARCPDTVVAVVSGRARDVLDDLVGDTSGLLLIGSHGAETGPGPNADMTAADDHRLSRLRRALQSIVSGYEKIHLEAKPAGIAVHLRGASVGDARAVTTAIDNDPATWSGVHVLRGKKVLELSVIDSDKGSALEAVAREHDCTGTLFLGDDVTDENVFVVLGEHDLGVKIGPGRTSADVRIEDPERVADLLRVVLAERRRASQ